MTVAAGPSSLSSGRWPTTAKCWSFCAAPPLEEYTGGWLDERAASRPAPAPSCARSRRQAILEGLCEGMIVEGKVTAIEGAALLVRLRKVRLLSPGGSFARPPEHLRHLWHLQLVARCDVAELADDVASSRARAAHLLGRFVLGDNVRGIVLRVSAKAATIAGDECITQQQQQQQQQQPAPQLELSFRDTLVRALYAAGAPDLGLFSQASPSHRSALCSSSSDTEDESECGSSGSQGSTAQSSSRGYGRGRKRKRSQPLFNSVLESEAVFANPYAVETMACSFGLGVGQGGRSISQHAAGLEAPPRADGSSTTGDGKAEEDTMAACRAFKRGRSFSFVLQNCTRGTNGQLGYQEDANSRIPEYPSGEGFLSTTDHFRIGILYFSNMLIKVLIFWLEQVSGAPQTTELHTRGGCRSPRCELCKKRRLHGGNEALLLRAAHR